MHRFADDCSIHGFKFIFGHGHSKLSRLFWILMVLLSTCIFSFYLHEIQIKWLYSPEFVVISRVMDLHEFPFPAVTICLPIFSRNASLNYTNTLYELRTHEYSQDECKILIANLHWCNNDALKKRNLFCDRNDDLNISETIKNTSMQIDEIFFHCTDEGNSKNVEGVSCTKKLARVLTDYGVCFTFNIQNFNTIFNKDVVHEDFEYVSGNQENSTWTPEKGYENNELKFPKRAQNEAYEKFKLRMGYEYDHNFCDSGHEYSVVVHLPNEIITEYHDFHYFKVNESFSCDIEIKSLQTNNELRRFSPDLRKCYFDDERKLSYFKTYTKALCEWECQSNLTFVYCGCVKFSMPRNKSMRVCKTQQEIECYANFVTPNSMTSMLPCDCYETCNNVDYGTNKISVGDIKPTILVEQRKTHRFAEIVIRCPNGSLVLETEKFASYKLQNLIADIGGLLGLCIGCSILSVIEIVFTIFGICSPKKVSIEDETDEIEEYNKLIYKIEQETEFLRNRIQKIENSYNLSTKTPSKVVH